jgi:phosphatidylethanolamine-binding protein (PEBP) family uncharacterized protein
MAGIQLRTPAFDDHQPIPARHAKDHDNLSPALEWSGVCRRRPSSWPCSARTLTPPGAGRALEDPDAPGGTFIHWVLAGLEPTATGLAEGEHPAAAVEAATTSARKATAAPWSAPTSADRSPSRQLAAPLPEPETIAAEG